MLILMAKTNLKKLDDYWEQQFPEELKTFRRFVLQSESQEKSDNGNQTSM